MAKGINLSNLEHLPYSWFYDSPSLLTVLHTSLVMSWLYFSLALGAWWADDQYWDVSGICSLFPRISSRLASPSSLRMSAFHAPILPWRQRPWTCSISSPSRSRSHSWDPWVEPSGYLFRLWDSTFRAYQLRTKYSRHWNSGCFSITVTNQLESVTEFVPSYANWYAQHSVDTLKSEDGHF